MSLSDAQVMTRLTALEQQFSYNTAPTDNAWFDVVSGKVPVLVSAPHACSHERDSVVKLQEEYTGALALYLAEVCHCHAIVTRYKTLEDPNWQTKSDYKNAIAKLTSETDIRFLIDLHGMMNRHNMGVALGTINGRSCDAGVVLPHFIDAGFQETEVESLIPAQDSAWRKLVVDHPKYTGGVVNHTVTKFAALECGVPAVQIELSSEARVVESIATDDWPVDYRGKPEAVIATVTALKSLVASFI